jgi:hypothetical protein
MLLGLGRPEADEHDNADRDQFQGALGCVSHGPCNSEYALQAGEGAQATGYGSSVAHFVQEICGPASSREWRMSQVCVAGLELPNLFKPNHPDEIREGRQLAAPAESRAGGPYVSVD